MSYPRVSLFQMTYNQGRHIREAALASLDQDYPNLEIVFSDDCSTDDTYDVLKSVVDDYTGPHSVKLFRNDRNLGIAGNFSTLIDRTEGEFIVQTNGDDVSVPERVSKLVETWRSMPDLMIVLSNVRRLYADGTLGERKYCESFTKAWFDESPAEFFINSRWVMGAVASYDRKIFETFGPLPPSTVFEDRIMPFRALLLGSICRIEEPLLHFRLGGTGSAAADDGDLEAYERRIRKTRVGDAKAFLSERQKYSFPGKSRVTAFCYLMLLRDALSGGVFDRMARRIVSKDARRRLRRLLSG